MRLTFRSGIGTTVLACVLGCCGCGGSLHDTPDLSKGPIMGSAKSKQIEELKAKMAKATQDKGKGKGNPQRRSSP
jgi:hypothetical protein